MPMLILLPQFEQNSVKGIVNEPTSLYMQPTCHSNVTILLCEDGRDDIHKKHAGMTEKPTFEYMFHDQLGRPNCVVHFIDFSFFGDYDEHMAKLRAADTSSTSPASHRPKSTF